MIDHKMEGQHIEELQLVAMKSSCDKQQSGGL